MTRSIFFSLFAFLLVMAMPSVSHATGTVKVGDIIPHNLALKDQKGKMRSFDGLKGEKGLTLVFIRSVEWCPFCQKQLIELSKNAQKFNEAGYPVVTVSYDELEQLNKFVTKNKPKITLLSDPRSESIRAFGILNKANAKGTMSYGIPHPGVYIVSKDKKVQAKFFKSGHEKRPSSKELLAKIKELNPPPKSVVENLEGLGEDPIIEGEDVISVPEKVVEPVVEESMPKEDNVTPDTAPDVSIAPSATSTPESEPTSALEAVQEEAIVTTPPAPVEKAAPIIEEPVSDLAPAPIPDMDDFPAGPADLPEDLLASPPSAL